MKFYSTNNKNSIFTLREAVLKGLPDDRGLFMPATFNRFSDSFIKSAPGLSFREIAFETARTFLDDSVSENELRDIVDESICFDAPLLKITDSIYALELFHGPTLAFKDFGARFMAGLMSGFVKEERRKLTILVATSGDTGGAVASGFFKKEGIDVIILYPKGKVSPLQEKQLTTFGSNIKAICIDGTFDDCQRLVKTAFLDSEINSRLWLSSANSINIARLIPQSFYYVYAWSRLVKNNMPVVFSVPSGNFGNLTAGLFANRMGLPVHHFIAATNSNKIVPEYLSSGKYVPKPSIQTISNAMDVGDPSNFARMLDMYDGSVEKMRTDITGFSFSDTETAAGMRQLKNEFLYQSDPHGAVGFLALQKYMSGNPGLQGVFLETAHPAKFLEVVEEITGAKVVLPEALLSVKDLEGSAKTLANKFNLFKELLIS